MSDISFHDYCRHIMETINSIVETGEAILLEYRVDPRSPRQGFIAGALQFQDGSVLHFREYVHVRHDSPRLMYAYHYQDAQADLIFRYDNAAHRPALSQSNHKHTSSTITIVHPPALKDVLDEIVNHN